MTVSGVEQELELWEKLKRTEKKQAGAADAMDAVCRTLPGLWRAEKIQKKAAADGPASPDPARLAEMLAAGAQRLGEAVCSGQDVSAPLGELLFNAVYAARLGGADPEAALHARCEEYIRAYRSEHETTE